MYLRDRGCVRTHPTPLLCLCHWFTEAAVRHVIMTSPIKSCSLDPVPMFLLREFTDLLLPFVTRMVSASLVQGRLPASQRHSIVTPRLKKQGLDTSDMSNYRPVSNLSYIIEASKVMEHAGAIQLVGPLFSTWNRTCPLQSVTLTL